MTDDYTKARKAGLKQVRADVAAGRFPYPPALNDLLGNHGSAGEVVVGTAEIPARLVVGTKTRTRQDSFSRDFMPLLDPSSEFAAKWNSLFSAQVEEGIRDPILVYEYYQRFYVQEGNKRVSVLRYLDAPAIEARITRVVPMPAESKEYRIYQEFLRFYAVAPVYGVDFAQQGGYDQLAKLLGHDLATPWPEEVVRRLRSFLARFCEAQAKLADEAARTPSGDALITYLDVYGTHDLTAISDADLRRRLAAIEGEIVVRADGDRIAYVEGAAAPKAGVTSGVRKAYKHARATHPFRVAFLFDADPATDAWDAAHEQGRQDLERRLGAKVETIAFTDCLGPEGFQRGLDAALADDDDLIVTLSSAQADQALRAALAHPKRAFVNCSVSLAHSALRMYSVRMFEAKFLLGALAAALAPNHVLGYVTNVGTFGSVAEINAFALGASLVDSLATVHLFWDKPAGKGERPCWLQQMRAQGVQVALGPDLPNPSDGTAPWGLFTLDKEGECRMAEPMCDWGRYYELLVRAAQGDSWRKEGKKRTGQALNYWWGMAEGVVDVRLLQGVPYEQHRLVDALRQLLLSGQLHPFAGRLVSQDGPVRSEDAPRLSSAEIASMTWLNHNVVGTLRGGAEAS